MSKKKGKVQREQPQDRVKLICELDPNCLEDLQWWAQTDQRILTKALDLIEYVLRDPKNGPGKPEQLRHLGPNIWSRRITGEHRLVYVVFPDRVNFSKARQHY